MKNFNLKSLNIILISVFGLWSSVLCVGQAPPNNFPKVHFDGKNLSILYDGQQIFSGVFVAGAEGVEYRYVPTREGDKVDLALVFNGSGLVLEGTVIASDQSFACEVERPRKGVPIVRHSFGPAANSRNQAVYDRAKDWVLSVDLNPVVVLIPHPGGDNTRYDFKASGYEIVLRFRPHYYQKHKGLEFYEPWNYQLWDRPVVGWCSWFAFWDRVTEQDMKQTADVLSDKLLDYGLEYIQMDDGYQQAQGHPDAWLNPNEKFPSGLAALADYIKGKGFEPGIWTGVNFKQAELVDQYQDYFVKDQQGKVAEEPWCGFAVDGSNPEALEVLVRPLYRGLREMGWTYLKLDGLRHLRYEGYNRHQSYFLRLKTKDRRPKLDLRGKTEEEKGALLAEEAFREYVFAVKEEIGDEALLMGCWGLRPELIGMIHACRIGGDGFAYAGLAQYNSFNNVVWQNDPDHIELSAEEAWRSTTVTSLTGSMYMLTDKPEVYQTDFLDAARRTIPVLSTRPGQIYEVDPSRIENLADYRHEISGSNHRSFDANITPTIHLYQLDVAKENVGQWTLLGRTGYQDLGNDQNELSFKELGLNPAKEYVVFEFWSKDYRGSFSGGLPLGEVSAKYNCEVLCIREREAGPQLLATNRHISCGALEITRLEAYGLGLKGSSQVIGGEEEYVLYLAEPEGFDLKNIKLNQGEVKGSKKEGMLRTVVIADLVKGVLDWELTY